MSVFLEKLIARHKYEKRIYSKSSPNRTLYLGETIKRLEFQQQRIDGLEEENRRLRGIIDEGLGEEDLVRDCEK